MSYPYLSINLVLRGGYSLLYFKVTLGRIGSPAYLGTPAGVRRKRVLYFREACPWVVLCYLILRSYFLVWL